MHVPSRRVLALHVQQRCHDEGSRQQQQDNGTHEFQPPAPPHGGAVPEDSAHSLRAYLERARQLGELPVPRPALRIAGGAR